MVGLGAGFFHHRGTEIFSPQSHEEHRGKPLDAKRDVLSIPAANQIQRVLAKLSKFRLLDIKRSGMVER